MAKKNMLKIINPKKLINNKNIDAALEIANLGYRIYQDNKSNKLIETQYNIKLEELELKKQELFQEFALKDKIIEKLLELIEKDPNNKNLLDTVLKIINKN
jgi:hypothetical protein